MTDRTRIQADVRLVDGWFVKAMGCGIPNPFTTSLADVARYNQEKSRLLFDRLGDLGLGDPEQMLDEHLGQLAGSPFGRIMAAQLQPEVDVGRRFVDGMAEGFRLVDGQPIGNHNLVGERRKLLLQGIAESIVLNGSQRRHQHLLRGRQRQGQNRGR
mgnify:CR=1 FL=1